MIHLDTNFLIQALRPETAELTSIREWFKSGELMGISSIAWSEFRCGPLDSEALASAIRWLPAPDPFLADDAGTAARLFNATGCRKSSLMDCMIAAVAIRCNAALATNNTGDFDRFKGLGLRLAQG